MPAATLRSTRLRSVAPTPKGGFHVLHPTEVAHSRRVGQAPTLYTEWLNSGAPINVQLGCSYTKLARGGFMDGSPMALPLWRGGGSARRKWQGGWYCNPLVA